MRHARPGEGGVLHDRDLAGELGERADGAGEHVVEVDEVDGVDGVGEEGRDRRALRAGERAQLRQLVDEHAVALVGRHAAGRGVRGGDELFVFEQGHVVADRGRRDAELVAVDDRLAADGLVRVDVVLHDRAEDLQSALRDHRSSSRPGIGTPGRRVPILSRSPYDEPYARRCPPPPHRLDVDRGGPRHATRRRRPLPRHPVRAAAVRGDRRFALGRETRAGRATARVVRCRCTTSRRA